MLKTALSLIIVNALLMGSALAQTSATLTPLKLESVKVKDAFWSPKLAIWNTKTVYDVLNKLEGHYQPDREDLIKEKAERGRTRNAFLNFDLVAQGKQNTGTSDGPPWYDGLVYETIRGAADLLIAHPDAALEKKLDVYIDRIVAAQAIDPDGYINTWTTLNKPGQRWGLNGGNDRWQHDVYNAGMLIEAGVHYYKATGKTKLLEAAVKMTNYMCRLMGPAPKKNIVPAHAGPEEALLKMYQLFKNEPALKQRISAPVQEENYYSLVKFWIEQRGHYANGDGTNRHSDGSYNQDHQPVFEQQTIEGHAVRATLLGTAVAAMAVHNHDPRYSNAANQYWNNMIGRRLFITGGQGAIPEDEKFGKDYYLPESAYLETCASLGAAFFSERMNELQADGKYVDELERVLYNNMLSSVAQDGQHYHYENPLVATQHKRWEWHSCPCCPPMFLKMIGALPGFIYAQTDKDVYVNLFIGSEARVALQHNSVLLKQETQYPWKGKVQVTVTPEQASSFTIHMRIPGWATGKENPFDLYTSTVKGKPVIKVNGKTVPVNVVNGYIALNRPWKKGDRIELDLPIEPRWVAPAAAVETIAGKRALAAGPLVYAVEGIDNPDMNSYKVDETTSLQVVNQPAIAGGVNVITGVLQSGNKTVSFRALPFYAIGNRGVYPYMVWMK
jgi:DUF1680 family protein